MVEANVVDIIALYSHDEDVNYLLWDIMRGICLILDKKIHITDKCEHPNCLTV